MLSTTNPRCQNFCSLAVVWGLLFMFAWGRSQPQGSAPVATTVPLILPGGMAYDSQGQLHFAEAGAHVIRVLTAAGTLQIEAGTGTQGFDGDGGAATGALLDTPSAVVFDGAGKLYFADSHNHRIRMVNMTTGTIVTFAGTGLPGASADGTAASALRLDQPSALAFSSGGDLYFADMRTHLIRRIDHSTMQVMTVAGNGVQGFAGDGGLATRAAIDAPLGLAFDRAGNLYFSDAHNNRVRRVDGQTGVITTVAGVGRLGLAADGTAAKAGALALPRGVVVDGAGNLLIVDSRNQRVRRVDGVTGVISTVAGEGTQTFAGDGSAATASSLNTPGAVALSPGAGLVTLTDSGNARVRQVDAAGVIHTIAGLGPSLGVGLALQAPSVALYGTGTVTATLGGGAASGSVTFFDGGQTLGVGGLTGNSVSLSLGGLRAGTHQISATYGGDGGHPAAQSQMLGVKISPAQVVATALGVKLLYGQAVPLLTGTLAGVLGQDAGLVGVTFSSGAAALSAPGLYPVSAVLTGTAAGNYVVNTAGGGVEIEKAGVNVALTPGLTVHVASVTSGVPTGNVTLLDGGQVYGVAMLSASGDAMFAPAGLSVGSHTLVASYAGDADFVGGVSAPEVLTVGAGPTADFALAATGTTAVSVAAGTAATFSFGVTPVSGALSSPILFAATGLPPGATASFNPAYLPPSNGPSAFILTVQTPAHALLQKPLEKTLPYVVAMLLPLLFLRRRQGWKFAGICLVLIGMAGCGDRVNGAAGAGGATRTYNITVTATATSATGAALVHSANVTLTVQ